MVVIAVANEIVAGIAQAVATVFAVVIGYGLSVLSEKKARQAVFDSQDRDRRLKVTVDIVDHLMQLRDALQAASTALSPVGDVSNSSATARASREAALSTAHRLVQPILTDAAQNARIVSRLSLTLRVLGADATLQGLAARASDRARSTVPMVSDALAHPDTGLREIADAIGQLDVSIEQLLDVGRKGV